MSWPFVQARFDYGARVAPTLGFVIHMAEGGGTVGYLARDPARGVSVHYVIEYSGRVVQMLLESHASGSINPTTIRTDDDADGIFGVTAAKAVLGPYWTNPNAAVLSVEIEGFAHDGPNNDQVVALQALVADIRSRFPTIGLLGHRDLQNVKACPGKLIPWPLIGGHGTAMQPLSITSESPLEVEVKAGTPYFDLDGSTILDRDGPSDDLTWRPSPFSIRPGWHAIYASIGGIRRVVLVKPSNTRVPPDPRVGIDARKAAAVSAVEAI